MTHDELVEAAAHWLYFTKRCAVVVTELAGGREDADAIGFKSGHSVLVECKVSMADLYRDKNKTIRRFPKMGMGDTRYLAVPEDMAEKVIKLGHLPPGWGLLACKVGPRKGLYATEILSKPPLRQEKNQRAEIRLLTSVIRRITAEKTPVSGVSVRFYKDGLFPSRSRATVGVSTGPEEEEDEQRDG